MKALLILSALIFSLSAEATTGLRSEMTVLNGAFIRAGGAGGRNDLDRSSLEALCKKGVSVVYYLYPSINFRNKGTINCGSNTLEYKGSGFMGKGVKPILRDIAVAASGGSGPVLAHCWNGWHASGEVAAYSLIQFCGWSGDQAAQYWANNIADKRNIGKYGSIMKRIAGFQPFSDIRLSEQQRSRICP
jgi:hypothetical protein